MLKQNISSLNFNIETYSISKKFSQPHVQRKRNKNPSCESVTEYHLGTQEPNVGEYKYILKTIKKTYHKHNAFCVVNVQTFTNQIVTVSKRVLFWRVS